MPEYLAPGVYVEEVPGGPPPIEGVSTSTVGAVGMAVRGPTDGLPKLVTSFSEFQRIFGGYLPDTLGDNRFLAYAVQGFFENGGQRIYIKRVPGNGAQVASSETAGAGGAMTTTLVGGLVTRLRRDALKDATKAELATVRGIINGTQLTLTQVKNGVTTTQTVTVTKYTAGSSTVEWAAGQKLTSAYDARYTTVATDIADPGTKVVVKAADEGDWGNQLAVTISHTSRARAELDDLVESAPGSGDFDTLTLSTSANFYAGAVIEIDRGTQKAWGKVTQVDGNSIRIATPLAAANDLDPDAGFAKTIVTTCEFRLTASYGGVTEDYPTLTLNDTTPFYYMNAVNQRSSLIRVAGGADNAREDPFTMPSAPNGLSVVLTKGANGTAPTDDAYVGVDNGPGQRTGLRALEDIDQVSIVIAPGMNSQTIQNFMIIHCETLKDRFAILDPVAQAGSGLEGIQNQRANFDTKYAALYYPRLIVRDPLSGTEIKIPPSGHMAGIYARTDNERGVHKAPANEVVRGITGLEVTINKGEQDILNPPPYQINVIRDFRARGRGLRVWGARCITSDAEWKYVPVRRLFIFLEESIEDGTQWVVFEPNAEPLWARVRQSVTNFLTTVWRNGALMGATPEEAFFVKCDRTTMTEDDFANGRLIMLIGVAPVRPAEFVIIRIGQKASGAVVEEL
jgi:phage tail sheath protein FI